jgi:hypothetical protein
LRKELGPREVNEGKEQGLRKMIRLASQRLSEREAQRERSPERVDKKKNV